MYETLVDKMNRNIPEGDSLFSLELVIDKLFIPHTTCRFPAIAFRLLDFPTILIKHVEDDLGKAIRKKISFDPDYRMPEQFIELKDKNGNFMVKKGKSCLFKISASILKQHLAQTPLYVMVTDLFPEVPKLVGNSTVPLDTLMNSICGDIIKLGPTVPSVHGDKGLFKIYNLMGKEIGYFVLGYRLLCLGPSLIPHLPESTLIHRQAKQSLRESRQFDQMLQEEKERQSESEESVVELRNSACMTDPIKHDVLMQTVEMEDKAIHVAVSETMNQKQVAVQQSQVSRKEYKTSSIQTQTEKRKRVKETQNARQKWVEDVHNKVEDDEIIINNIICPPPLFYNSEADPPVDIERVQQSSMCTSIDELSEIDSFDGEGLSTSKQLTAQKSSEQSQIKETVYTNKSLPPQNMIQPRPGRPPHIPQTRPGEFIQGLQVAPQPNAIFPILTALINELACIQDPQLLLDASNKLQQKELRAKQLANAQDQKIQEELTAENISPSIVSAVAAALARKYENRSQTEKAQSQQQQQPTKPQEALGKDKLKSTSVKDHSSPSKKNKLAFGLTNTQRLRLQKTNPGWLKQAEKQAAERYKSQRKPAHPTPNLDDINATVFSDTLTEVRRLAELELESTAGGDTLRQIASEAEQFNSTLEQSKTYKKPMKPSKTRTISPKSVRASVRRSLRASTDGDKQIAPKAKPRLRHRRRSKQSEVPQDSSDSDDEVSVKRPVPLESFSRNITSPAAKDFVENDEGPLSARSELASSRSRSIEVHLPSAQQPQDNSDTITDSEDEDIPLPDDSVTEQRSVQGVNLPRYFSRDTSLPESIKGVPNESLNVSGALDDNSPLESTRHSKNLTEEQNDSRVLHSTDYDTRQFHSTDEPELQGLMSEEENRSEAVVDSGRRSVASVRTSQKFPVINPQQSESSPVPSVRRSTTKLDPGAYSYLPSMSLSKGQLSSPSSSRPSTPTKAVSNQNKGVERKNISPKGGVITPRGISRTPRSPSPSPKRPAPHGKRPLRDFRESIHTESLSSYMPSDPENMIISLSSNSGNYSDDFQPLGSGESGNSNSGVDQLPKLIPSAKLGYTIN